MPGHPLANSDALLPCEGWSPGQPGEERWATRSFSCMLYCWRACGTLSDQRLRELQASECGGRCFSVGRTDHIAAACTPQLLGEALPLKVARLVILQLTPLKNGNCSKPALLSH